MYVVCGALGVNQILLRNYLKSLQSCYKNTLERRSREQRAANHLETKATGKLTGECYIFITVQLQGKKSLNSTSVRRIKNVCRKDRKSVV